MKTNELPLVKITCTRPIYQSFMNELVINYIKFINDYSILCIYVSKFIFHSCLAIIESMDLKSLYYYHEINKLLIVINNKNRLL